MLKATITSPFGRFSDKGKLTGLVKHGTNRNVKISVFGMYGLIL